MALKIAEDGPRLRVVPDTEPAVCGHCGTEATPSNPVFRMAATDPVALACRSCLTITPGTGDAA